MDYHTPIKFSRHPWVWIQDKRETGINAKGLYVVALMPAILMLIGFVANVMAIFQLREYSVASETVVITLSCFLFVFGLINLAFLHLMSKAKIRLEREYRHYHILHKDIIEKIRDYRTHKRWEEKHGKTLLPDDIKRDIQESKGKTLSPDDIKRDIQEILSKFNDNYMKKMHSPEVSAVIKYRHSDNLVPIRVGGDKNDRNNEPELLKESFIYQALNEYGKPMRYIYVKNLDDPDKYEYRALGKYIEDVKSRAGEKYSTFIALQIRMGQRQPEWKFKASRDLGMLGFDRKKKYGFGNFERHELEYIACFVDMMSELVQDLIEAEERETANEKKRETQ